jgi:hypothetical protein
VIPLLAPHLPAAANMPSAYRFGKNSCHSLDILYSIPIRAFIILPDQASGYVEMSRIHISSSSPARPRDQSPVIFPLQA